MPCIASSRKINIDKNIIFKNNIYSEKSKDGLRSPNDQILNIWGILQVGQKPCIACGSDAEILVQMG